MRPGLNELLADRRLWRAGEARPGGAAGIPTGFASLDAVLPGGGWPRGALTEILIPRDGIGELQLVMPALARLCAAPQTASSTHTVAATPNASATDSATPSTNAAASLEAMRSRWVVWVAPPWLPYAPALASAGMDLSRVLVVRPDDAAGVCWAMEQSLRSGSCAAVLGWVADVDDRGLRRLQLAAEEGAAWAVLFRPQRLSGQASPAVLRIRLLPGPEGTQLELLKNRGSRPQVVPGTVL